MKNVLFLFLFIAVIQQFGHAQVQEATLLGRWTDDSLELSSFVQGRYNECWGVYQNGTEIGIIGSTKGTHFINLSDPSNPTEIKSAFIGGASQGTHIIHRDYHDYNGFLYAIADEGLSTLQVIDIRQLPDTAFLVYDSADILHRAHDIFIDSTTQRLYACSARLASSAVGLAVMDISVPESPQLLAAISNIEGKSLTGLHDMYVRKDTAYLNVGNLGLYVVDFSDINAPKLLGTVENYPQRGYNHSGWLNESAPYYYFADETHGTDMKALSVADYTDLQIVDLFDADSPNDSVSIAHNLISHCDYLYVAHYYDGLQVYDLKDPAKPERVYFYDTFDGPDDHFFAGAWGVFPFLPSGNILISDIQGGLFVFQAIAPPCSLLTSSVDIENTNSTALSFYPNPITQGQTLSIRGLHAEESIDAIELFDFSGKLIARKIFSEANQGQLDLALLNTPSSKLSTGLYLAKVQAAGRVHVIKLLISE